MSSDYSFVKLGGKFAQGRSAIVSPQAVPLIKKYKWVVTVEGFVITRVRKHNRCKNYFMHRLIMGCKKADRRTIMHLNGNRLDNRFENLAFGKKYKFRAPGEPQITELEAAQVLADM